MIRRRTPPNRDKSPFREIEFRDEGVTTKQPVDLGPTPTASRYGCVVSPREHINDIIRMAHHQCDH